jgi:hypothetical protein
VFKEYRTDAGKGIRSNEATAVGACQELRSRRLSGTLNYEMACPAEDIAPLGRQRDQQDDEPHERAA